MPDLNVQCPRCEQEDVILGGLDVADGETVEAECACGSEWVIVLGRHEMEE